MKLKILASIILISILSCRQADINEKPLNSPSRDVSDIKDELFGGNIKAYNELRTIYLDMYPGDFLFYAMFMANTYDYAPAYLDVFDCFNDSNINISFNNRDKKTKKMMLEYLNEAIKKNVPGAKEKLVELNNPANDELDN